MAATPFTRLVVRVDPVRAEALAADLWEAGILGLSSPDADDFIRRHHDEPFCLYVSHLAIHNPVQIPGDPVRRTEEEGWKRWKQSLS